MAAAAYASVHSLLRVIDKIQQPTQVDALQGFLEVHSSAIAEVDIESIVRKIRPIAYDAENSIDRYVVDQLGGEREEVLENDAEKAFSGLLANSDTTLRFWLTVPENVSSAANSANDEYCLSVVLLSYHHLPIHLKPCFLYMRHAAEESDVYAFDLFDEWVAQGSVKPTSGRSLEESARGYLEDLVGRSTFLTRKIGGNGNNAEDCAVHDLLRDLASKNLTMNTS